MKKLLNLVCCLALALHLNACTSNDSKDESEDGAVAEDTLETESADAALESDGDTSEQPAVADNNEGFLDEQLPEDALGESAPAPEVAATEPPPSSMEETPTDAPVADSAPVDMGDSTSVASESPMPESTPAMETPPSQDSFAAVDTGSSSESVESTPPSSSVSASSESSFAEEKPKPVASLKKVEMVPFKRSGVLLNAVYIGRPGDSFASISKNIYGNESKSRELKKVNPYFSKVRPGDKVYYNSPVRPTDDTKVLTYYEDSGMMPETYVSKDGDNLRTIAQDLVGYKDGWKEIWVTNNVDSKTELAAGTELRFWRTVPVAAAPPATPPADMSAPPSDMSAPPAMAQTEMPPPPPSDMGAPPPAMDMPPPDAMAAGMQDLPPPPPAEAVNPPPPPPAPVVAKKAPQTENIGGLDNDMIMTLGGAGILVAAIALLMIVRKRRQQKEMSAAFGDTHVGT